MANPEVILSQEYVIRCEVHDRFEAAVACVGPATYRTKDGCVVNQSLVYDLSPQTIKENGGRETKGTTLRSKDQKAIAEFIRGLNNVAKEA